MKKLLTACAIFVVLSSCGGAKKFNVEVEANELGTQLMTIVYTTEGGNRVVKSVPAVDGKFSFDGVASGVSMVEIFNSKKQPFAAFPVSNGEDITLTKDSNGEISIEGSELSSRLFELLKTYCDTTDYSQEPTEIVRLLDDFYSSKSRCDSGTVASPELFIRNDSVVTLPVEGYWFFTSTSDERTEELIDSIKSHGKQKHAVRDIWIGTDTLQWRSATHRDSATWVQAMLPDAPLHFKNVLTSTPMMIETDSAGTVIRIQRFE